MQKQDTETGISDITAFPSALGHECFMRDRRRLGAPLNMWHALVCHAGGRACVHRTRRKKKKRATAWWGRQLTPPTLLFIVHFSFLYFNVAHLLLITKPSRVEGFSISFPWCFVILRLTSTQRKVIYKHFFSYSSHLICLICFAKKDSNKLSLFPRDSPSVPHTRSIKTSQSLPAPVYGGEQQHDRNLIGN